MYREPYDPEDGVPDETLARQWENTIRNSTCALPSARLARKVMLAGGKALTRPAQFTPGVVKLLEECLADTSFGSPKEVWKLYTTRSIPLRADVNVGAKFHNIKLKAVKRWRNTVCRDMSAHNLPAEMGERLRGVQARIARRDRLLRFRVAEPVVPAPPAEFDEEWEEESDEQPAAEFPGGRDPLDPGREVPAGVVALHALFPCCGFRRGSVALLKHQRHRGFWRCPYANGRDYNEGAADILVRRALSFAEFQTGGGEDCYPALKAAYDEEERKRQETVRQRKEEKKAAKELAWQQKLDAKREKQNQKEEARREKLEQKKAKRGQDHLALQIVRPQAAPPPAAKVPPPAAKVAAASNATKKSKQGPAHKIRGPPAVPEANMDPGREVIAPDTPLHALYPCCGFRRGDNLIAKHERHRGFWWCPYANGKRYNEGADDLLEHNPTPFTEFKEGGGPNCFPALKTAYDEDQRKQREAVARKKEEKQAAKEIKAERKRKKAEDRLASAKRPRTNYSAPRPRLTDVSMEQMEAAMMAPVEHQDLYDNAMREREEGDRRVEAALQEEQEPARQRRLR